MLAADNGHEDVVLLLMNNGANLDLVDRVSVDVHVLYYTLCTMPLLTI